MRVSDQRASSATRRLQPQAIISAAPASDDAVSTGTVSTVPSTGVSVTPAVVAAFGSSGAVSAPGGHFAAKPNDLPLIGSQVVRDVAVVLVGKWRRHEHADIPANDFAGRVPEQSLGCRIEHLDRARRIDDNYGVHSRLDDGAPPPLGFEARPLCAALGRQIARDDNGGADALTVANTYLAMAIDTDTFVPRIHNITGGLSGPAIKPITLRLVYQCARAVKIPVIGLGGIFSPEDAVEYFLAGACAVQIGTANFQDPRAPLRILDGLEKFMAKRGFSSLKDIIGKIKV